MGKRDSMEGVTTEMSWKRKGSRGAHRDDNIRASHSGEPLEGKGGVASPLSFLLESLE